MAKLSYSFPKFFGTIVKRAGLDKAITKAFRDLTREIEKLHQEIAKAVNANAGDDNWTAVSFENSWVNFDGGFHQVQYRFRGDKTIELRGRAKSGTVGLTIFTLDALYQPSLIYSFDIQSNGALGRIDILSDGSVDLITGSNVWVSLDGITFRTD